MAAPATNQPVPCPSCGTPGLGHFCAQCGAVLVGTMCGACRSLLPPGARFCHRCGAAVGAGVARSSTLTGGSATVLPWVLVGLALVVLLVIIVAQRSGSAAATPAGVASASAGTPPFPSGANAAPDISSMSPRERANRLFNRVMQAATEGKQDSVMFFASMASTVYESLGDLDIDLRYDYGRVAEVSGRLEVASAQADSILRESSSHLLGLILAARVAERRGDQKRRDVLERQLLATQATELRKPQEEYTLHRGDIDAAISAARMRMR